MPRETCAKKTNHRDHIVTQALADDVAFRKDDDAKIASSCSCAFNEKCFNLPSQACTFYC
uniref:Uncharacterized protein n=1 Tax=Arundo donax TaxID=35708 RepID=A0A0A8ZK44_ARUDO